MFSFEPGERIKARRKEAFVLRMSVFGFLISFLLIRRQPFVAESNVNPSQYNNSNVNSYFAISYQQTSI